VCDWFGVECANPKNIDFININGNNLFGPVSAVPDDAFDSCSAMIHLFASLQDLFCTRYSTRYRENSAL